MVDKSNVRYDRVKGEGREKQGDGEERRNGETTGGRIEGKSGGRTKDRGGETGKGEREGEESDRIRDGEEIG